ncbi:MAG: universal stress protein [Flavobacteriales bacterium]
MMNDILCPTDLTDTAMRGVLYADVIAARLHGSVSLLHVMGKHELKGDGRTNAKMRMDHHASLIKHAPVSRHFREGDFIHEIAMESRTGHALMVCATHGPHGLRQSLFGSDILTLVRKVAVASLVVQEQSPLPNVFSTIVLPVAGHDGIDGLLIAVTRLALAFDSEVHVYQVMRPGETPSDQLLGNKRRMLDHLAQASVRHIEVNEPSTAFSVGFAAPTIAYSERVGAGCIAIMSVASDDYRYIADAEKERLLTNGTGIPVLCAH